MGKKGNPIVIGVGNPLSGGIQHVQQRRNSNPFYLYLYDTEVHWGAGVKY